MRGPANRPKKHKPVRMPRSAVTYMSVNLKHSKKGQRVLQACFSGATVTARIVYAPFRSPEAPIPATARPTMNIAEDCAAPHNAEPSSKMKKQHRKVHCVRID